MNTGSKKFNADGFYTWLLLFIVLIVGGYMAYAGLIKRKTTEAVSAAVNMLVIFLLTAAFIAYAPQYIKNINDFSADLSNGVLELGAKLVMPGNDEMGVKATDKIRNNLFAIQVYNHGCFCSLVRRMKLQSNQSVLQRELMEIVLNQFYLSVL